MLFRSEHVLPLACTTNVASPLTSSLAARAAEVVECREVDCRRRPCTVVQTPLVRSLFAEKSDARLLAADAKRTDPDASPVLLLTVEKRRAGGFRPKR